MNLLKLGKFYVSDFVAPKDSYDERNKYTLDIVLDESIGAARLASAPPHSQMWGKYWYRSGTNKSMTNELKNIAEEVVSRSKIKKENPVWLDIACNDGTMFKFIPDTFSKIGIDPADDSFVKESSQLADKVIQEYFSADSFRKTGHNEADIITTIAMFYDLENPHIFLEDIKKILAKDGLWVIQISYTPLMLEQLAFDNICHEHFYYYSLNSLKILFKQHGLKIVDANLNDTNGGSIRIYIQKEEAHINSFGSAPLRDVCNFRINSLLEYENNKCDISNFELWQNFANSIQNLKEQTVAFLKKAKAEGKIVGGYGASTKGNTLLQLFGIDNKLLDFIAERSPYKYGLKTIGTNIPIISEQEMRERNPDYLLVLPWHFINEFVEREQEFLENGGKFIVPCPKFEIIEYT